MTTMTERTSTTMKVRLTIIGVSKELEDVAQATPNAKAAAGAVEPKAELSEGILTRTVFTAKKKILKAAKRRMLVI